MREKREREVDVEGREGRRLAETSASQVAEVAPVRWLRWRRLAIDFRPRTEHRLTWS